MAVIMAGYKQPMLKMLRPRMIAAGWRRRTEFAQAGRAAFGRGSFVDRMSGQLAAPAESPDETPDESAELSG